MNDSNRVVKNRADFKRLHGNNGDFDNVIFKCEMDFNSTPLRLDEYSFKGAVFEKQVKCKYQDLNTKIRFEGTTFYDKVIFNKSKFWGAVSFKNAAFHGEVDFGETKFPSDTIFTGAVFHKEVDFTKAIFKNGAFDNALFHEYAIFKSTQFPGIAIFSGTEFSDGATFERAKFSETYFNKSNFRNGADFTNVKFSGMAFFYYAKFSGATIFFCTRFFEMANFESSQFDGNLSDFSGAIFEKSGLFTGIKINNGTRETYRIVKNELLKNANRIDALLFHQKEMKTYRKEILVRKWYKSFPDISELLILNLNYVSNNYGLSWVKGLGFTIVVGALFYFLYLLFAETCFSWEIFTQFLNPAHSYDIIEGPGGVFIIDGLARVFVAYGYYQTISAFRKYRI